MYGQHRSVRPTSQRRIGARRRFFTALILTCSALSARRASAQSLGTAGNDYLTVGGSLSIKLCCGPGGAVGLGPGVSYAHWASNQTTVGGYAWLQYYPGLEATRFSLGPQASYLFGGAELGPSVLLGSQPPSWSASATPFASIGFVWTGIRVNFGARTPNPIVELVFGGGLPVGLHGSQVTPSLGSGRPVRIDGTPRISGTRGGVAYGPALHPKLPRSRKARLKCVRDWSRDAALEYSSIAAFEHLGRYLEESRAPADLVRRCRTAARDEAKHARMCYGLASAYVGRALGPRPLDLHDLERHPARERVIFETILDGCVGEAIAAADARAKLRREPDPVVKKVLRAIARDESAHARLAWSVVVWSEERGAMVRALDAIGRRRGDSISARVHRRVAARLGRLLAGTDRMAA